MREIKVVDYNPNWTNLFKEESKLLSKIFQKEIIWIEHIGSTSIPNLCAKPIIDILIVVRDVEKIDSYKKEMEHLGYIAKGEFGIPNRSFFIKGTEDNRTHHIHIFQVGNPEIARHINFKYYLITHSKKAKVYGDLKKSLALKFPNDINQYMNAKNDFLKKLEDESIKYLPRQNLQTERLILRPFKLSDADKVQYFMKDKTIADGTLTVPYPYEDGVAEKWIRSHRKKFGKMKEATFAITKKDTKELMGTICLIINKRHQRAEIGYWLGKQYRNKGYCTEAALKILEFGFIRLSLHRIFGIHFAFNPSSGSVMKKIGMQYEGYLRGHIKKYDKFQDVVCYGILVPDYNQQIL